ncbi:hypothetical protein [Lelliottia sp. CFBP8978]|nr:hypothetical protein [Lelliottia sp. CFBP8978]
MKRSDVAGSNVRQQVLTAFNFMHQRVSWGRCRLFDPYCRCGAGGQQ